MSSLPQKEQNITLFRASLQCLVPSLTGLDYTGSMKLILLTIMTMTLLSCSHQFTKTVDRIEKEKFMGTWYVIAGRFTFLEKGQHNSVEKYTWNEEKQQIDIEFTFNKDSFDGPLKSIPQTAFIHNQKSNAHWKVQPFWPLKLDYLVLLTAPDYSWTAIGVPSQKYLWIMAREKSLSDSTLQKILKQLEDIRYNTKDLEQVPQKVPQDLR